MNVEKKICNLSVGNLAVSLTGQQIKQQSTGLSVNSIYNQY